MISLALEMIPEPVFIQALVSEATIEAFNEAILSRLPRLDQLQFHPVVVRPLIRALLVNSGP